MLPDLPQFVPQKVCLNCDGCCRFKDEHSIWRPKKGTDSSVPFFTFFPAKRGQTSLSPFLPTVTRKGQCQCAFFNAKDNTCGIYGHRPWECQLYPFLFAQKEGNTVVAVHLACPYIQQERHTPNFSQYVKQLKIYFDQSYVQKFLLKNRFLATEYSAYDPEIEYLFPAIR